MTDAYYPKLLMCPRHTDLVGQYKKDVCQMFADSAVKMIFIFDRFADGQIDQLAKMTGVIHEADHAYYTWSTW